MDTLQITENEDGSYGDQSSNIILYRHAESEANMIWREKIPDEEKLRLEMVEKYRDTVLCENGINQCENRQEFFNKLDIQTVFVSPLRRAMQTAYHTFKTHPNLDKIRFVVVPDLREIMNLASGIPYNIEKVIEEFSEYWPNIDTSLFDKFEDKLHYFLYNSDEKLKEEILGKLEPKEDDVIGTNAFNILLEKSKAMKPLKLESNYNVLSRVNKVKELVTEHAKTLGEGEKAVVVTHFFILEMWTGQWEGSPYNEERNDATKPSDYFKFKNTLPFYYSGNDTASIQKEVEEQMRLHTGSE